MTYSTDEEQLTKKQRLEDAETSQAARRKRLSLIGGVLAVLAVAAVVAVAATSGGGGSKKAVSGAGAAAGLQATPAPWAPEYTGLSTRLQALNLPTQNDGAYHVHAAVRLYVHGRQVAVPANIGIEPGAESMAPLHTHDSSGVIHIESSEKYPFTLGQLFTIWGVKFTNTQLGSYLAGAGNVFAVYANGRSVPNPVGYVLNPHDDIVVAYGKPGSFPTSFQYNWAAAGI